MQKRRNEATIDKAFKGLIHNKHQHLISGLKGLLDDSVNYALNMHKEKNLHNHLATGDSYGWAIGYNGKCLDVKVTIGKNYAEQGASVSETLSSLASNHSKGQGYIGIVMAGMEPSSFYKLEYEEEILYNTVEMVAAELERYFTKI